MKLKKLKKIRAAIVDGHNEYVKHVKTDVYELEYKKFYAIVVPLTKQFLIDHGFDTLPDINTNVPGWLSKLLEFVVPLIDTQIKYQECIKLHQKIDDIYQSALISESTGFHNPDHVDDDFGWDSTYEKIFSKKVSKKVHKLIHLDYYDPDTSYKEDVQAFVNAALPALQNEISRLKEQQGLTE